MHHQSALVTRLLLSRRNLSETERSYLYGNRKENFGKENGGDRKSESRNETLKVGQAEFDSRGEDLFDRAAV